MGRNYFSIDEIVLCAYAAMYDAKDFGGYKIISSVTGRSAGSILMKIRNFASLLDDEGVARMNNIRPLSGMPPGESGRKTNWDIVSSNITLPKSEFKDKCISILDKAGILQKTYK